MHLTSISEFVQPKQREEKKYVALKYSTTYYSR